MKKIIYISLIITVLFLSIFSVNYSFATEEDVVEEETVTDDVSYEDPTDTGSALSTLSYQPSTSVSNINSYSQANLELNNIVSIILIAVGIVLILLAIAILIKK